MTQEQKERLREWRDNLLVTYRIGLLLRHLDIKE